MREMKDSGVEWIGAVPTSWQTLTIGSMFKVRNEKVNDTDYPPLSVTKGGIVSQMENVAKSDANDNRKMVLANDFVINSRSDRKQSCGVSPLDGSVSLINTVLYPAKGVPIVPKYLNYLLKNYGFAEEFYRWGHGIVADLWTTRWQEMKSILLPIPSMEEQQRILDAISAQTEKVDTLITNVQEQIEKLKAYKQSVITEVVTKGLDPTVPMKDSGIEWIGEIPAHWIANKIIRCFGVIGSGTTPKFADDTLFEGDINWIQSGDINGGILSETRFQITKEVVDETSALKIYSAPFIVIAMYGASIGNISISQIDACTNQACCVLSKPVEGLLLEYLFYAFKPAKDFLIWKADGGGQPNISQDKVKSLWIPIPPTKEQEKIIQYLNIKCGQIDDLIAIKQAKIEKLEQYKCSLIYEYVTGKKEV